MSLGTERRTVENLPKIDGACGNSWPEWLTDLRQVARRGSVQAADTYAYMIFLSFSSKKKKKKKLLGSLATLSWCSNFPPNNLWHGRWHHPPPCHTRLGFCETGRSLHMSSIFISVSTTRPPQLTCGKDNLGVIFLLVGSVDGFSDLLRGHGKRETNGQHVLQESQHPFTCSRNF